jgi:hypothetical protein
MTRKRIIKNCLGGASALNGILALFFWDGSYLLVALGFLAAFLELVRSRREDSQLVCRRPDDYLLN